MSDEYDFHCTNTDCLGNTPVVYKVVDLSAISQVVLEFAVCLECAIACAYKLPENQAKGVQIIVHHNPVPGKHPFETKPTPMKEWREMEDNHE